MPVEDRKREDDQTKDVNVVNDNVDDIVKGKDEDNGYVKSYKKQGMYTVLIMQICCK